MSLKISDVRAGEDAETTASNPKFGVGEGVGRDFQLMLARIIHRYSKGLDLTDTIAGARDLIARKGSLSPLRDDEPEATRQSSPSQTPVDPQMTVDPWQLITTAPRNGTLVAIKGTYLGGGDWESKGWFETSPADRCWYDAADDEPCRPTHWHPIAPSHAPSTTEADHG